MNQMMDIDTSMNAVHDPVRDLSQIDLNLLVAFDLLARERSVTRAAERAGVSQSAMSHTLRRLRDLLHDPILVRGAQGMHLTERAEAMMTPVRSGLATLGRAIDEPGEFEPATSRREFRIAAPDLFEPVFVPAILKEIGVQAPGVDVAVMPVDKQPLGPALETGAVDVAIVPFHDGGSSEGGDGSPIDGFASRRLFRDRFRCLVRAGHPAYDRRKRTAMSCKTYADLSHALVSPDGEGTGLVDVVLAKKGLARRVSLRIPHFYSAPEIIAQSDLVLTVPATVARLYAKDKRLVSFSPPIALPEHSGAMIWHPRFTSSSAHQWFRSVLVRAAKVVDQQ